MSAFVSYVVHGIAVGCGFALLASGLIIIYRVTRVVNLAQGTFAVAAAFLAATLLGAGVPHGLAELLTVLVAALLGVVAGVVTIGKPGTSPQASLIASLGLSIFGYAVEILLWGDQPRSFAGLTGSFELAGVELPKQYALIVVITLLVFGLLDAFFELTYLGKALSACASNPYAARLVGINVVGMSLCGFALGGALGGVAGVLLTPMSPVSYDTDVLFFVNGFAAAIMAGLKRPLYALGGGIGLGVAESLVAGYAKASYQSAFALLLTVVIVVVQSLRSPSARMSEE
ncbi:MAG TPA: branched-chain amino acid ABC transporter permease [Polyangiaceae bacterium]|nr:branched-chain amino acid ABC transporter permease [Polyangiaceae bacterium]